jgi:hypothetical protein
MAKRPIDQKKVAKYLGVLIDENLSWKPHINNINIKMRSGLAMMYKTKAVVSSSTLRTLYYSFIYPYLDYNLINWSSAPKSHLKCIDATNKKAVLLLQKVPNNQDRFTGSSYKQTQILPLEYIIKLRRGTFMWKLSNNILPDATRSWFHPNTSEYYTRMNVSKYQLPHPRTELARRHNSFSATKLWNSEIPEEIKRSFTLQTFKSKYKAKLLSTLT